jgi:hypothetical protein
MADKNKKDDTIFQGKISGKISFDDLEFSEVYTRVIEPISKKKNASGRVYLPANLVKKEVYILVKK